jgi:SAM-dependent methyltransferase
MSDDSINWNIHAEEAYKSDEQSRVYPGVGDIEVFAKLPFSGKVLDLGSNICRWYNAFKWLNTLGRGIEYHAYDSSYTAKGIVNDLYPEVDFVCDDVYNLISRYPPNEFDCVFTSAFIQHFSNVNKRRILKEIVEILKPGGHYIMVEQVYPIPENYTNDRAFSLTGWHIFMGEFDLHPVKVTLPYMVYRYGH